MKFVIQLKTTISNYPWYQELFKTKTGLLTRIITVITVSRKKSTPWVHFSPNHACGKPNLLSKHGCWNVFFAALCPTCMKTVIQWFASKSKLWLCPIVSYLVRCYFAMMNISTAFDWNKNVDCKLTKYTVHCHFIKKNEMAWIWFAHLFSGKSYSLDARRLSEPRK